MRQRPKEKSGFREIMRGDPAEKDVYTINQYSLLNTNALQSLFCTLT